jgi:hypothetical protein
MVRNDTSKFLLYIEPKASEKLKSPIIDDVTKLIDHAFGKAVSGSASYSDINDLESFRVKGGWRGWHTCDDGEDSDNHDYLFENGMITNSLCIHYIMWFRNSIGYNDWIKLQKLGEYYGIKILIPNTFPTIIPTEKMSWDDHIKKMETDMVETLSQEIQNDIIKKVKKMGEWKPKK